MPDQPENKKVPWGMMTGLSDPERLDGTKVIGIREAIFQIGRDLGLATQVAPEQQDRYRGLRMKYTPRINQVVQKTLWEYPDLALARINAPALSGQIADIDGLTAVKDAADQLSTHLGLTITLRQGHVAERVNEGVMEMKERVEDALRTGAVDKRMMAAYQPVVSMWEKEVERLQQRQQDTASATARVEGEAAAWKAQAEAYKKQLDDVTLRLQQLEARLGGALPPMQPSPEAPTPPGKDARKDRR